MRLESEERETEMRRVERESMMRKVRERMEMREDKIPNILKVILKIIKSDNIQILEYGQNSKEVGDVEDLLVVMFQISIPIVLFQTIII